METIEPQDVASLLKEEIELEFFGNPPQPWQLRNNWVKPKRKRNRAKPELDIWKEEE